MFLTEHNFQ